MSITGETHNHLVHASSEHESAF